MTRPDEAAAPGEGANVAARRARVDALFGGEPPPPPVDIAPRLRRLRLLVGAAVLLDLAGLLLTVVPGAAVTLWAWLAADDEVARMEHGGYDDAAAAAVLGLRMVARGVMLLCIACLLLQAWLLHRGFYNGAWAVLLDLVSRLGAASA